jgi:short subunit fatty acids transporter
MCIYVLEEARTGHVVSVWLDTWWSDVPQPTSMQIVLNTGKVVRLFPADDEV